LLGLVDGLAKPGSQVDGESTEFLEALSQKPFLAKKPNPKLLQPGQILSLGNRHPGILNKFW
jgi:hypothetical protein